MATEKKDGTYSHLGEKRVPLALAKSPHVGWRPHHLLRAVLQPLRGEITHPFQDPGATRAGQGRGLPFLIEFALVLECKVLHVTEIGLHKQFIGEVMDAEGEEGILDENGALSIIKGASLPLRPRRPQLLFGGRASGQGLRGGQDHQGPQDL